MQEEVEGHTLVIPKQEIDYIFDSKVTQTFVNGKLVFDEGQFNQELMGNENDFYIDTSFTHLNKRGHFLKMVSTLKR